MERTWSGYDTGIEAFDTDVVELVVATETARRKLDSWVVRPNSGDREALSGLCDDASVVWEGECLQEWRG
ncbi:hypothetical protein M378DRAFT_172812 [Amanita muscaria Koide BX008]|uniref:Uncharacterized protein n=1 Tax=Amanita muscaria (strain Koide BX008) TaxID=946122 RepID=A0A0C2W5C8_AMAMK|nr:hypothetical protein M378DRAFT_172812 [Amanita muscaria Koide BX008]